MDDDLPLKALAAKTKKPSYDDDLPLAKLAMPGAKTKERPSGAGRPPRPPTAGGEAGAGKPKPKPAGPARKKEESSSSSDSSGSSSSSDSSSVSAGKKKVRKASKLQKTRLIQKKKREAEGDNEDNSIKKKERSPKEQVVVDLMCRWWYGMPEWPPDDPDYYREELAKRSLRQVSIQEWEWVPDVDEKGHHKVYELTQFKGIFRKADGEMVDVRPRDSCPSFNNFMKKDTSELYSLLVKAYENQLKDLEESKYDESELRDKLTTALNKIRLKAGQAAEMNYATGGVAKKPRT